MPIPRTRLRRLIDFPPSGSFRKEASSASRRRLVAFDSFGTNPGALGAKKFVPSDLPQGAALVVVLHGCTQTAESYEGGAGWSQLAARHGFAVLCPEQQRANNMNLCFNWFEPGDMARGGGEPESIKQMIDQMVTDHGIDPGRIFITGLSAGAAMAAVMLATYPDVFAGGGLIAGLPYGSARTMGDAMQRMRRRGTQSDIELAALVRGASPHAGPWPRVSIWHGTSDRTVDSSNADATVAQWRAVHDLGDDIAVADTVDGYPHRVWRDARGRAAVEEYSITGMGHGTPLDPGNADGCGTSGAFLLDVGISSTQHIAAFWGLIDRDALRIEPAVVEPEVPVSSNVMPLRRPAAEESPIGVGASGVQKIIEDALRSAGLMR